MDGRYVLVFMTRGSVWVSHLVGPADGPTLLEAEFTHVDMDFLIWDVF